jgi:chromosome segregation ATPase
LEAEKTRVHAEEQRIVAQLQAQEQTAQVLRAQLTDSQERTHALMTSLEERVRDIAHLRSELERITADRDGTREQLDRSRAAFDAERQDHAHREAAHTERWAAEVDRARLATKATESRLGQLEERSNARIGEITRSLETIRLEKAALEESRAKLHADLEHLRVERTTDAKTLEDLKSNAETRESQLLAQYERVQLQLTDALAQLAAKDQEHGALLRQFIASAKPSSRTRRQPP